MICNAFAAGKITPTALSAMKADAAQCNRRLSLVLKSVSVDPGDGETQFSRIERDIAATIANSAGQPFTRLDVMEWTGRSEPNSESMVRRMVIRGLAVRDGTRGRAHLYRWTDAVAAGSLPADGRREAAE